MCDASYFGFTLGQDTGSRSVTEILCKIQISFIFYVGFLLSSQKQKEISFLLTVHPVWWRHKCPHKGIGNYVYTILGLLSYEVPRREVWEYLPTMEILSIVYER